MFHPLKAVFTLAFLTLGLALTAQDVSFGFKVGANLVDVKAPDLLPTVEEIPEFQSIWTHNFGLVSEIQLTDHFAIQPELSYTTKGFKLDEGLDVSLFGVPVPLGATAISRFNYLELPVLAKVEFGNEVVKGYALAGPTIGYALNGKITTRAKVLVEIDLFDTPINLDNIGYERLELGATAGAGVAFNTGGGELFLDARYLHGLTEVYDVPLISEKVQNRGLALNAGYLIHF